MPDELKPCPFCGGEPWLSSKLVDYEQKTKWRYYYICKKCFAKTNDRSTKRYAAKAWNRRSDNNTDRSE